MINNLSKIITHDRILFPILLFTFACNKSYEYIAPGEIETIQVRFQDDAGDSKSITCIYSVPQGYTPEKDWPLVVALHGGGSNAPAFHDLWYPLADSLGFVLVTPQGENKSQSGIGWSWGNNAERSALICLEIIKKE